LSLPVLERGLVFADAGFILGAPLQAWYLRRCWR
jgi:hypothetical protein